MDNMDIDALIADLPVDGEPEPVVHDAEQEDDDSIVVRSNQDPIMPSGEVIDVTKLSDEDLLDLLSAASEAADPSGDMEGGEGGEDQDGAPPAKKPKVLGQRWATPPPKPVKGRRPWQFGHKLYALIQLKKHNNNAYAVRTKILKHWDLSRSHLSEWKGQEDTIRKECQKRAQLGALKRCRLTGAGTKASFQQL